MIIRKNVDRQALLDIVTQVGDNVDSPDALVDKLLSYLEEPDTVKCLDCGKPLFVMSGGAVAGAWTRYEIARPDGSPGRGDQGFVCNMCHDIAHMDDAAAGRGDSMVGEPVGP